ncbi:MAG TPA: menaquinone biosynthesis protein [Methylomirabilota bacterium]|jgi:chorismate dehydratase|nr:menaquinone biosynthesis protein [Methylomirabilota bacterium]
MLRVGRISYLNVEPFFHAFPWPIAQSLPPRALGEAVAGGQVDAGPLALADCVRLEGTVGRLPFGIVGPTRAQSVLLFSDRPIAELGGCRIAVTGETSTSVRLLRILLAFRYEVPAPTLVGLDERADAVLLIGDAALRALRRQWPRTLCHDLGDEWTSWTGHPMVFAAWAVRLDTPAAAREGLESALGVALDAGLASLPAIAARRRDVGLSEDEIVTYLGSFRYRIGPDEEKAVAEYRRLLALLEG